MAGAVGIITEIEKLADRFKGKPQLACVPDKGQAVNFRIPVAPLPAFGATWFGHQADLFVIPDSLNFCSGLLSQTSNCQHVTSISIALVAIAIGIRKPAR
jgi:hypothetical protein